MGNHQTRLVAEKQRAVRLALVATYQVPTADRSVVFMRELRELGFEVKMIGGDTIDV